MDSLTLTRPIPVCPERSGAKSKDALMPPVPIVQRFRRREHRARTNPAARSGFGGPTGAGRRGKEGIR